MPRVLIPIFGVDSGIDNSIGISVTKDIYRMLGFNGKIPVLYGEDNIAVFANMSSTGKLSNKNTLPSEYIKVTIDESVDTNTMPQRINSVPRNEPLIRDESVNMSVIPVYHRHNVEVSFSYYTSSKSKATAMISMVNMLAATTGVSTQHNLEYSYPLPNYVINLLEHILSVKKMRVSDFSNTTLPIYVSSISDNRVNLGLSADGDPSKANYSVRERLINVQGSITDDTLGMKKQKNNNRFSVEFTYTLQYQKPLQLFLSYELLNHNIGLPKRFIELIGEEVRVLKKFQFGQSDGYLLNKSIDMNNNGRLYSTVVTPSMDIITKPTVKTGYKPFLSVLIKLDEKKSSSLLTITDIDELVISPVLLDFLRNEGSHVGSYGESFFLFTLNRDGSEDYGNKLSIDTNLMLNSSGTPDILSIYRVVIYFITDIVYLNTEALRRLLDFMYEYYLEHGLDVELGGLVDFSFSILGRSVYDLDRSDIGQSMLKIYRPEWSVLDFEVYIITLRSMVNKTKTAQEVVNLIMNINSNNI
jgi:hypothetical protein